MHAGASVRSVQIAVLGRYDHGCPTRLQAAASCRGNLSGGGGQGASSLD